MNTSLGTPRALPESLLLIIFLLFSMLEIAKQPPPPPQGLLWQDTQVEPSLEMSYLNPHLNATWLLIQRYTGLKSTSTHPRQADTATKINCCLRAESSTQYFNYTESHVLKQVFTVHSHLSLFYKIASVTVFKNVCNSFFPIINSQIYSKLEGFCLIEQEL